VREIKKFRENYRKTAIIGIPRNRKTKVSLVMELQGWMKTLYRGVIQKLLPLGAKQIFK
jgi:hypothetical protein